VVEAAGVDGDHRSARPLPAREGADAADPAEQMMDVLLVELVVGQRLFALLQREGAGGHERKQRAGARADGAVALGDGLREIDVDAIAHGAAVAAPVMGVGHGKYLLWARFPA